MTVAPRPDWERLAERLGFLHHTSALAPYWTDDVCYVFEAAEVEELDAATGELWSLCIELVDRASRDDEVLRSLRIVETSWDAVRSSWLRRDPSLVTRFDLAYDGNGAPKLHECNGDTPGTLFEASVFQWVWLEDQIARGVLPAEADQFNRLHPALVAALSAARREGLLHATASTGNIEDQVWARYIADCARQAGRDVRYLPIEDIGVGAADGLVDHAGEPISDLVRAYRLNLLLREPFGGYLTSPAAPRLVEPFWKLVLASKGSLVWLWRLFPGHPNLLPCWFEGDPGAPADGVAIKPLFSIKGYNVTLRDRSLPGGEVGTDGPYGAEGRVVQRFAPLPTFGRPRCHASVSTWIVGDRPEGLGVLESDGPIVNDLSCRFVPHVVGAWDGT